MACPDNAQQREVCFYGAQTALHTLFSTLWLCGIGFLCGKYAETLIIISVFYLCQTVGGGKHKKTMLGCTLLMTVFLLIGLLITDLGITMPFIIGISLLSCGYLWAVPLVLHPNKAYLVMNRQRMICISRICTCLLVLALPVISAVIPARILPFAVGLFFSALSRASAFIEYTHGKISTVFPDSNQPSSRRKHK